VRISYSSDDCAWNRFNAILKDRFNRAGQSRLSIRIDREWHTTRTIEDIIQAFDDKLSSVGLHHTDLPPQVGTIEVLSGNEVGGDAIFTVENFHIGVSPFEIARQRSVMLRSIHTRLEGFLKSGGRFMVVVNHAPPGEQGPFWCNFWKLVLERLVNSGLFLVHFLDRRDGSAHPHAPQPLASFTLPNGFEGDDEREGDAYDDLIDALVKEGVNVEEAPGAAVAHLNSNLKSVADLQDNLFSLILRLEARRKNGIA
jgi:hypothetical protein